MKKSMAFSTFRNVVYFGCMVFAYGIAGSLELGRLSFSEAVTYLLSALFICFGINLIRFGYLLIRALRLKKKKEYGTGFSSARPVRSIQV